VRDVFRISIGRPTPPFFYYVVMNTKTFSLCCGPYSERMWSKMSFYFWKELIPKIEFLLRRHPPPKFVVIQLGSNDLGTVKGWQLAESIICDILRYRLCNISDHTISVFGIKACIRRMSHIMLSASCQPLTVPRSFDPRAHICPIQEQKSI
jgi:hypothetical protein